MQKATMDLKESSKNPLLTRENKGSGDYKESSNSNHQISSHQHHISSQQQTQHQQTQHQPQTTISHQDARTTMSPLNSNPSHVSDAHLQRGSFLPNMASQPYNPDPHGFYRKGM